MFLVFSIIHFPESNQILKDIIYNDENLCLQSRVSEPYNFDAAPAPTLKLIYQFLFIIEFDKIK